MKKDWTWDKYFANREGDESLAQRWQIENILESMGWEPGRGNDPDDNEEGFHLRILDIKADEADEILSKFNMAPSNATWKQVYGDYTPSEVLFALRSKKFIDAHNARMSESRKRNRERDARIAARIKARNPRSH